MQFRNTLTIVGIVVLLVATLLGATGGVHAQTQLTVSNIDTTPKNGLTNSNLSTTEDQYDTAHTNIEFGEGVSGDDAHDRAQAVHDVAPAVYRQVRQRGLSLPDQVTVRIVSSDHRDGCLNCAFESTVYLRLEDFARLKGTLVHEYTHVSQFHNDVEMSDGLWNTMIEGHAEVESWSPDRASTYSTIDKPSMADLRTMGSSFSEYEEARFLVEAMMIEYGRQTVLQLLRNSEGADFEREFERVTGDTFQSFYEGWRPEDPTKGYSTKALGYAPAFIYDAGELAAVTYSGPCSSDDCRASSLNPAWDIDNDGVFEKDGAVVYAPFEMGTQQTVTLRYSFDNITVERKQTWLVMEAPSVSAPASIEISSQRLWASVGGFVDIPITYTAQNVTGIQVVIENQTSTIGQQTITNLSKGQTESQLVSVPISSTANTGNYSVRANFTNNESVNVTKKGLLRVTDAPVVTGLPAQDIDGDGKYKDVNGDGEVNVVDVQALFSHLDAKSVRNNPEAFDYNGDNDVNVVDVQALFAEI